MRMLGCGGSELMATPLRLVVKLGTYLMKQKVKECHEAPADHGA
jgi:hypothetical protein